MNKQKVRQRTKEILIEIHRGFLTEEASATLTDLEILSMVPPNRHSIIPVGHKSLDLPEQRNALTPFTEKWVRKQVKGNLDITSLEVLKACGFVDDHI